jgi:hypothetical protein
MAKAFRRNRVDCAIGENGRSYGVRGSTTQPALTLSTYDVAFPTAVGVLEASGRHSGKTHSDFKTKSRFGRV